MNKNLQRHIIETGDFAGGTRPDIHPITHSKQLFDVYRLSYECNRVKDTHVFDVDGLWILHPEFDHIPETTILVAEFEGEIIGTATMTLDGANKLPLDKDFAPIGMLSRSQGRRLAQVWRVHVKDSFPLRGPVLTSLLTAATTFLLSQHVQTSFMTVPEDDEELCGKLLNAVSLMPMLSARGLSDSVSILMRVEMENLKSVLPTPKTVSQK